MSKTAVIYWSGTGNTEAMAKAVLKGAGLGAQLFAVSDFDSTHFNFLCGLITLYAEEVL